jgi:hypothetical protein
MSDAFLEGSLARVVNLQSRPERNGTCVRLGKRTRASTDQERWETRDDFTFAESALRPTNLEVLKMQPRAQSMYRLLTTSFLVSAGSSNDLVYHLLSHSHELPLLYLALVGKEVARELAVAPHARLEALRVAARELCAAAPATFSLTRDDACIRRPPLPSTEVDGVSVPRLDESITMRALRLSASADTLPSVVNLPALDGERLDYYNVLAEALGVPAVAPLMLASGGKAKGGQRAAQPILYVSTEAQGGRNALASALGGTDVHGDALLTSLEFRDDATDGGMLTIRARQLHSMGPSPPAACPLCPMRQRISTRVRGSACRCARRAIRSRCSCDATDTKERSRGGLYRRQTRPTVPRRTPRHSTRRGMAGWLRCALAVPPRNTRPCFA